MYSPMKSFRHVFYVRVLQTVIIVFICFLVCVFKCFINYREVSEQEGPDLDPSWVESESGTSEEESER